MVRAKETRVAGSEVSVAVAVVMAMGGAAPHRDNCHQPPDGGPQDQQEFCLWRETQMRPMAGGHFVGIAEYEK